MTSEKPETLTVRQLFAHGRYRIPRYQRAYAWGHDEIRTLLRDVQDYRRHRPASSYYLGSLVVHAGADGAARAFEVIDGQQRMTTLLLTLCHGRVRAHLDQSTLDRLPAAVEFEARSRSTADLRLVARGGTLRLDDVRDDGVRQGVKTIDELLASGEFNDADISYLLDQVKVVRSPLPSRTDLNHYFEVMNSRGEQLEKHEVVKANLLGVLRDPEDRSAFARIWDACSVMDQHVQSQFTPDERDAIFGEEWDSVPSQDFAQVRGLLRRSAKGPDGPYPAAPTGLLAILKSAQPTGGDEDSPTADDEAGRYGFIVDFSNFLLHALKLQFDDAFSWDDETASTGRVSLDDKTLIEQFRMLRDPAAVQKFAGLLLRLRFLLDAYVIKPDRARGNADDANWVLRRAHLTGSGKNRRLSPISTFRPSGSRPDDMDAEPSGLQRRIVMAQSMFQVTDSRRSYKNFLYAILRYLQAQSESDIDGAEFLTRLHQIAEQRVLRVSESGLNGGTRVAHFVFNFLDYAWWLRFESGVERPPDRVDVDGFRFRYRTSVEHFYPQHPETTEGHNPLEPAVLDALGNLCIMTRSDNSRRSNLMPMAKIAEYDSTQQSLKFQLMAAAAEEAGAWGDEQIRTHGDHARDCLRGSLFRLVNWPG